MTILGVFLNKEMRTGANRRYLELMEEFAMKGNRVCVIMNTLLDYTPSYFTKIPLTVHYKRRGFPPASFLFRRAVKRWSFRKRLVFSKEALWVSQALSGSSPSARETARMSTQSR